MQKLVDRSVCSGHRERWRQQTTSSAFVHEPYILEVYFHENLSSICPTFFVLNYLRFIFYWVTINDLKKVAI